MNGRAAKGGMEISMYKIAILDKDEAYLERLLFFLKEHHGESFEITTVNSLDDLDMEVMQCNALFFGDDVAVDDALFPAEIAIGYLTEKEETGEQYINKYQSMEQIYKRMLRLCEEEKPVAAGKETAAEQQNQSRQIAAEFPDFGWKAETVTTDGETYRIYHIEDEQVDRLAVRMLTGNRIRGLIQTEYRDSKLKMRVTGMSSLYEYVQKHNTLKGKEQMLKYFADMLTTALSLEEYMLSADRLMLNPREIYVNEAEKRVLIPYIPLKGGEPKDSRKCLEEIKALCSVLIDGTAKEALFDASAEASAEEYGITEEFENLQKNAKDSLKLKGKTKKLGKEAVAYIVRKRTGEKTVINRNLFKLGKDASYVDYCIKDNPAVSRNHADIVRKPDGFYLVDKGSLNHTFVNGKKLAVDEYRKLEDGCLMQLADDVFEFRLK